MARDSSHYLGLCPEVFNSIDTPAVNPSIGSVGHGIPSYASLEVLIAYLTSTNAINYDPTLNFLMVYRSFTNSIDLWQLLASRLLWAADQAARAGSNNEVGKTVGTRCFVMLRCWIREYFEQDFIPNIELRSIVAETLTALAGCTEFILVEHFSEIMAQIRREWDGKVNKYWVLPREIVGNVDSPVPMGGDPLLLNNRKPQSYVLNGSVPIDADIAVPSIQASPKHIKPRRKISTLFLGKSGKKSAKNEEVILHNKVDVLAMKVINEYHEKDRRNITALHHTIRNIRSETPEFNNQMNNILPSDQTSFRETPFGEYPSENTGYERFSYLNTEDKIGQRIPSHVLVQQQFKDRVSDDQVSMSQISEDHSTPTTSIHVVDQVKSSAVSLVPSQTPVIVQTNIEDDSLQGEESLISSPSKPESEHHQDDSDVVNSTEVVYSPELEEHPEVIPEPSTPKSKRSLRENLGDLNDEKDTIDQDIENEGLATPSRSPDSFSIGRLQDEDDERQPSSMSHEQSMDTLNVKDMILANPTGESAFDEFLKQRQSQILDDASRVSVITSQDNWDSDINFESFDKVSFVGSSLSTISTSTRSGFYAYQPEPETPRSLHLDHGSSSGSPKSISLMSEIENSLLQPCEGYTAMDAARLRALPDSKIEGDAILATLNKLEGVVLREKSQLSIQECNVPKSASNIRFAAPYKDNEDVLGLGISTNDGKSFSTQPKFALPLESHTHFHRDDPQTPPQALQSPFTGKGILRSDSLAPPMCMASLSREASFINQPDIPKPIHTLHIGLPGSTHAPFILSYNARSIAEQMTLIECEISKEIDWQELLQPDYQRSTVTVTSWLQIVMSDTPLMGIELVLSRFDLVYKWVQSEVLLCPTAALQAQTVSRFIHIAFESLRLQNFATMVQLVLALSSKEVESQLGMEYSNLLPAHDRDTLDLLLCLATSNNNYSKLRKAHGRISKSKGCVPYTPMFIKDIEQISQLNSVNSENEIHFDKYDATAKVVNDLKHCVESTNNYSIEPEYALMSKCLHIASL